MKQKYRHSLRAKDTNAEKDCELGMKVTMTRLSLLLFCRRTFNKSSKANNVKKKKVSQAAHVCFYCSVFLHHGAPGHDLRSFSFSGNRTDHSLSYRAANATRVYHGIIKNEKEHKTH